MNNNQLQEFWEAKGVAGFIDFLNILPTSNEIHSRNMSGSAYKYIPIQVVEDKLDAIFLGLWSVEQVGEPKIVANEILISIHLKVFHPIHKVWITRLGVGAAMIQQKSGSDNTDINAKIKNTLEKDFPHAKANAVKNAAKSIGRAFGRSLMRKEVEVGTASDSLDKLSELIKRVMVAQDNIEIKTITMDKKYLGQLSNPMFQIILNARLQELSQQKALPNADK